MKIFLTVFFVVFIFFGCIAQSITDKKTTWSSTTVTDLSNNSSFALSSQFILDHNQTIKWIQNNGGEVYTFSVSEVLGQWSNTSENGSIDFVVSLDDLSGHIVFFRNNDGLQIKTIFNKDGVNDMPFIFIINSVQVNP